MFVDMQSEDYQPVLPSDLRHGIGIVGCGITVREAQVPAYKKAGYHVVACCDRIEERAHSVAASFGIPLVTTDVRELLSHPEVQIVDLAVHAHQRLPLVEQIADAGKHILSQKPLAPSLREA
ncbi:MAG: Gfo/Idh/MocA family oxidoreductase, partial [Caldilineaceae bacterium]|nr:Gfo/Idh/MocA family oxidoreductase [Caldilineaceae bacterium]